MGNICFFVIVSVLLKFNIKTKGIELYLGIMIANSNRRFNIKAIPKFIISEKVLSTNINPKTLNGYLLRKLFGSVYPS